ncbi:IclR family transcriptional regulator C-terminal domain-containing protein [Streptomyces sp. NPDC048357]|uniref:IclR family transcriptional regulator domain-containing protein n=1 Tax=Streptomyces sp. NPDC048357 TaxID=3154719 RepID=UPI00343AD618
MSRLNDNSSNLPAPAGPVRNDDTPDLPAPTGLVDLMAELAGPPDHWDRPDGDFGPLTGLYRLDRDGWERVNSLYRMGSKALGRGELAVAANWLGEAAAAGHPGAMFRMAVAMLRAGEDWADEALFLVAEAARHGHGDAGRLLAGLAHRRPAREAPECEDTEYFEEVREGLGVAEHVLHPVPAEPLYDTGRTRTTAQAAEPGAGWDQGVAQAGAQPRLFLVPAPHVPTDYGHAQPPDAGSRLEGERPHLAALPATDPQPPIPDLRPDVATPASTAPRSTTAENAEGEAGEPWWSANALRPALLTDMARHRQTPTRAPIAWQTTQRARDLLLLIGSADGIDTRTLAHRAKMSMNNTALLLDWLRAQRLVDTIAGAHHTGPVLDLATRPDPEQRLLEHALEELRDELGAAVYISTYTGGEIEIQVACHSPAAPPVREWAPFKDTGHASAVGKSLLAQLDFESRMDHLTRYPSIQLTDRTITSSRALIEALDQPGPHAAQFDLLEYSKHEVCVAYSLGLPGHASSVALSLPARQYPRLITAARVLSERAASLLLAHLLTDTDPHTTTPAFREAQPEPRRALP